MKIKPLRWGRRIAPPQDGQPARCLECSQWLFEIRNGKPGRIRPNVKLLLTFEDYNFEWLMDGVRPVDPKNRISVFRCPCGAVWNFEEPPR